MKHVFNEYFFLVLLMGYETYDSINLDYGVGWVTICSAALGMVFLRWFQVYLKRGVE